MKKLKLIMAMFLMMGVAGATAQKDRKSVV